MLYRDYKSIGWKVSQLGFGCMRPPSKANGRIDRPKMIRLLRMAFKKGVNYFDAARAYGVDGESEDVLGIAVKPFRDKVVISTKNLIFPPDTPKKWYRRLEESCEHLGSAPDIMNFHSLTWENFVKRVKPKGKGLLKEARRAQTRGLFKHLAFSCHDKTKNIIKLLKTGEFVGVTLQYNLLNRGNEDAMEYAYKKGLGVVVMGPVGGGKLAVPSKKLQRMVPKGIKSTPEIALRFVLGNRHVSCTISGMNAQSQLLENLRVASMQSTLSSADKRKVKSALQQTQKLAKLYCTGCGYCMPCPNKVNIPRNFELMNWYRVWDLKKTARKGYAGLTNPKETGLQAKYCKECGVCVPKCPQKIDIIKQLKETHKVLGA